jgi:hypothetical protein
LAFQATFGLPQVTLLLDPILWIRSALWLLRPTGLTGLFAPEISLIGLIVAMLSYVAAVAQLPYACSGRGYRDAIRATTTVPVYWTLMMIAAYKGFLQLLRPSRRHCWELTRHGLVAD